MKAILVDVLTSSLWVILQVVDGCLCFLTRVYQSVTTLRQPEPTTTTTETTTLLETKTVVIVGGNFAGLAALWELASASTSTLTGPLRIVLIDEREYSEYTPGILRLPCDPEHFANVAQPLPTKLKKGGGGDDRRGGRSGRQDGPDYQFIQGRVTSVIDEGGPGSSNSSNSNNSSNSLKKILTYIPTAGRDLPSSTPSSSALQPKTLSYDYLILATGTTYAPPISPSVPFTQLTLQSRLDGWREAHERLRRARRILILGGGAVGVELAAEIVDHYAMSSSQQAKDVTLLDVQPGLVTNFPRAVGEYARDWLVGKGVTLLLGRRLASWDDSGCILHDGTVLPADLVYVCFGNRPNSQPLAGDAAVSTAAVNNNKAEAGGVVPQAPALLTGRRTVVVGTTLQVQAASPTGPLQFADGSIFACGDVAEPPTDGEKQAFQAEMQGKVAARNVLKLLKLASTKDASAPAADQTSTTVASAASDDDDGRRLYQYPRDLAHSDTLPLIFVLSLGRYDGVLGFNGLIIPGPLAAVVKWILEYTKVLHMRGEPLGKLIWKVGDTVVLFLNRTLIRPVEVPVPVSSSGSSSSTNPIASNTHTLVGKAIKVQ